MFVVARKDAVIDCRRAFPAHWERWMWTEIGAGKAVQRRGGDREDMVLLFVLWVTVQPRIQTREMCESCGRFVSVLTAWLCYCRIKQGAEFYLGKYFG